MKKNSGFTLIELMIVIALIIILGSLMVPFFTGGKAEGLNHGSHSINAQLVEDHPDLTNCKELKDDNRVIYSCPDGKIYTK